MLEYWNIILLFHHSNPIRQTVIHGSGNHSDTSIVDV
jgi:hypothetical protein